MTFTAGPTNVATGDPITVRVQITGRGALQALTLPEQSAWHDFKTYPPTSEVQTSDPLGWQGTKTFEQIVVPQSSDIKELPPVSFSFFDPEAKGYRTLTQPAIKLVVRAGSGTPAPIVAAGKSPLPDNPPPPQQDIVPIKQRLGTLAQVGAPLAQQPWFLAMQSVPVLAWIAALVWRKRAEALANNPRLRRHRRVAQIVRDGLNELRRLAFARWAERKGIGPIYALTYGPPLASIELFAEQAAQKIDPILAATGARRLVVIAHSMGGLVMRAYWRRYGGAKVARIVTVGTPHEGSVHAWMAAGTSLSQIRPRSTWLTGLGRPDGDAIPPIVSIWSWHDSMVAPQTSSRIPFGDNIALAGVAHNALLRDPQVFGLLADEIERAR